MQLALPQGRIGLHLRQLPEGSSVEVDIPRGGVWLLQSGIYDIAAGTPEAPAHIMVFEGSARFVGGPVDVGIKAGDAAVISGTDTLNVVMEPREPEVWIGATRSYSRSRLRHSAG